MQKQNAPWWLTLRPWLLVALVASLPAQIAYTWSRLPKEGGLAYIHTQPSGAEVSLVTPGNVGNLVMGPREVRFVSLGNSPGPLLQGFTPDRALNIRLRLRGYRERVVLVPAGAFAPGRNHYPESGTIALEPTVPVLVPLLYTVRDWPFAFAGAGLLVVLGVLAAQSRRRDAVQTRLQIQADLGDFALGVPIGPYRLGKPLGVGGMARVFEATRDGEASGEVLALKIMSARLSAERDYHERFKREVNVCRALRHPNIVQILDWGEVSGHLYLVMEKIEGSTLADHMITGPLSVRESIAMARQIAEGLSHAHAQGVIHRDVKPANVLLTPAGKAVITDFGIARRADLPVVTEAGGAIGTPAYIAPESLQGQTIDWRADLYALGLILHEMLSGQHPYATSTGADLLTRHTHDSPRPLREVCPDAPPGLEALVARLVSRDPAGRATRIDEVALALRELERTR